MEETKDRTNVMETHLNMLEHQGKVTQQEEINSGMWVVSGDALVFINIYCDNQSLCLSYSELFSADCYFNSPLNT